MYECVEVWVSEYMGVWRYGFLNVLVSKCMGMGV